MSLHCVSGQYAALNPQDPNVFAFGDGSKTKRCWWPEHVRIQANRKGQSESRGLLETEAKGPGDQF